MVVVAYTTFILSYSGNFLASVIDKWLAPNTLLLPPHFWGLNKSSQSKEKNILIAYTAWFSANKRLEKRNNRPELTLATNQPSIFLTLYITAALSKLCFSVAFELRLITNMPTSYAMIDLRLFFCFYI